MAITAQQMAEIQRKAQNNIKLVDATPDKQQAYDNYQKQYMAEITKKAQSGTPLVNTNPWKQSIYDSAKSQVPSARTSAPLAPQAPATQSVPKVQAPQTPFAPPTPYATQSPAFDQAAYLRQLQEQVNSIYDQQRQAQLAELYASRDKALGLVNQQKAEAAPQFQSARNQADVVNAQNVQRLRELMAANGLNASGENITASVGLQNARQAALNDLNLQEQQTMNDFDRQIADINNPANEQALIAALEAQRSRALLDMGMRADELGYSRMRDAISDSRYDYELNYKIGRDTVADNRYADETQYRRGRDEIGDTRHNNEFAYQQSRDAIGDQRWQQQFDYGRSVDDRNFNYQVGRDSVADKRWQSQFDYQASRDKVGDSQWQQQFNQSNQQYADEKAWRQYTYNNMSAAERARMDQAASQFGEEMAWKMYSLEYQGELDKSIAEAQMGAYGKGNFNVGTGLGALSQKYESSGNPGVIANNAGDIGGKSYGMYQLATNMGTPKRFVDYLKKADPQMAKAFEGRAPGSAAFDSAWKTLATTQKDAFASAQHNFIKVSYFDPVVKKNPWVLDYPKAVQDAVWSTSVQHGVGGANKILEKVNVGMTPQSAINAIYSERGANNGMKYFSRSSPAIRQSVLRRFENERKDALSMLR